MTPELIAQEIRVSTTPSDMHYHISKLKEYSSKVDTIIDFGIKDMTSSWGLLAGIPKYMRSYDLYYPQVEGMLDTFYTVAKDNNVNYEFNIQNTIDFIIEPIDFLFIDSLHTYSHLKQELLIHANKVNTYIGFHDTQLFAHCGQQNSDCNFKNSKGLLDAIREFMLKNKDWNIDYHTDNCNGLTILKKG